jgi:hypothetical protein
LLQFSKCGFKLRGATFFHGRAGSRGK